MLIEKKNKQEAKETLENTNENNYIYNSNNFLETLQNSVKTDKEYAQKI